MATTPEQFGMYIGQLGKKDTLQSAGNMVQSVWACGKPMNKEAGGTGALLRRISDRGIPSHALAATAGSGVGYGLHLLLNHKKDTAGTSSAATGNQIMGVPVKAPKGMQINIGPRKIDGPRRSIFNNGNISGNQFMGIPLALPENLQFNVGPQLGKQAFLGPGLIGAGLGAVTSPENHRMEGAYRGAAKATGTAAGGVLGMPLGVLAAAMLLKGKNLRRPRLGVGTARRPLRMDMNARNVQGLQRAIAAVAAGAPAGAVAGGAAGYGATSAALGKPSWEQGKTAAVKQAEGYATQLMNNLTGANVNLPPQQKTMAGRMTDPNYSVLAAGGQHIAKQIQSPFKPVAGPLGGLPAMANALNNTRIAAGRQLGEHAYSAGKTLYNNPARAMLGGLPSAAAPLVPGTK